MIKSLSRLRGLGRRKAPSSAKLPDTVDPPVQTSQDDEQAIASPSREVAGFYDGIRGDDLYGWACHPSDHNLPVCVEICFDGVVVGEVEATIGRPDLRAAGVGHGRFGWRFQLPPDLTPGSSIHILIRSKGGAPLEGGSFTLEIEGPFSPHLQQQCDAFVAATLGDEGARHVPAPFDPAPPANFLLYSPVPLDFERFGASEYSYAFVRKTFEPLLEKLGSVHHAPDAETADRILEEIEAKGETAVLLSFSPPHRTIAGARCPAVPVIAWEYPTIPTKQLDGDPRQDWRLGLRQAGRAITLSEFAASAIRYAMGQSFPVAAIPAPVFDRFAHLGKIGEMPSPTRIKIKGFVFDTRGRTFRPWADIPPLPDLPTESYPDSTQLDGVVFTSIFSPRDRRKNAGDIIVAFLTAHRDHADATLVLKMIVAEAKIWWWEVHDLLNSMPPFACRVVVLHGYLDDENFNNLIGASHWIVNASNAEGLCLPLLEYMSAGIPAIAPRHTAMAEYLNEENALIIDSDEEWFGFPHDPDMEYLTTRHRVEWDSIVGVLADGYRIATMLPDDYAARSQAARETMRAFCSDEVVAAKLDSFLGLNLTPAQGSESPSPLLRKVSNP